ncbi:NAD-dependent epimerase/dehydratase family protein [Arthrobacter sp. H20]|uniref:NAD-dependent epimerase/dehydratase family protein n=1 Tax=Arthrobacter sp. H20 TaxID=1267981 RepID=UPI00047BDE72|nr:NAD-dependent epimerase/dehydratase family protein [Arthrobacter sp. H20]
MEQMVVTGAGPVGWTVAEQLAAAGHRVRILSRTGNGPESSLIQCQAVDVSDPVTVMKEVDGATAVFHCIHAAYNANAWRKELPQAEQNILAAAGSQGAVVAFPESLYSYSQPDQVMTEAGPRDASGGKRGVRTDLLKAREASSTPTVSVVAADFFGPRVLQSHMGERVVPRVIAGQRISVIGSADTLHSFTYVPDLATALIAAALDEGVWNTVLHAPTLSAGTQRQMVAAFAAAAGVPPPHVGAVPGWVVRALGRVQPLMRELAELLYQTERPFTMSSTASEKKLGLAPTPLAEAAAATVNWWRDKSAADQRG